LSPILSTLTTWLPRTTKWSLTLREERKLQVVKTVFKIVLAPKKAKVCERFRILHNEKLRHLSGSRGIVEQLSLRWVRQEMQTEAWWGSAHF
jgi:bifunctional DNA-binding transcriptional regulator/antitoxin component of YhaV-PrlF toxin-antitoxin module